MDNIVDGDFWVVSMMWHGPIKTDPETGVQSQPTRLVTRVYDEVKNAEEAFGKAYDACLDVFDEEGWTLKNHTVTELETLY